MSKKPLSEYQNVLNGNLFFRFAGFFLLYFIAVPVVSIVGLLVYHLRVKGRKNLKGHKCGMIASNHCQFIEPGFAAVSMWPKRALFSAEENNITRKDVGWLVRLLGTFGIPDDNPLSIGGTIKAALAKNWFVHFYPEGVLYWRSQEPAPFMEGVFFFAYLNNVPVFPMAEVLKDRPLRRIFPWWPPKTTIVYCKPVYPDAFRQEGRSRREVIHLMSEAVRNAILNAIKEEGGCTTLKERRLPPES